MTTSTHMPLVVAITGASGAIYGVELLKALRDLGRPAHLIVSQAGARTLELETGLALAEVQALAERSHAEDDLAAPVSSGSFATAGMVVLPCSIKTLSAVAHSFNHNLIARAADVCLKERRRLVLAVRETPLHQGHLEMMARVAGLGAVILPPLPAFYHHPATVLDIVRQSVGKVLDQFAIDHQLYARWQGPPEAGR